MGATGGSVTFDEGGAHFGVSFGGFELGRHASEEAVEDELFFYSDDGVVGAGHAYIRLVGGAVVEDALVGGGNVGVGADDGGDAPVQVPADGDLFRGGFGVEVEEYDLGCDLAEKLVGFAEGVVAGGHEDAALEVEDGVLLAIGQGALVDAKAGSAVGVVCRADDAAAADVGVFGDGHILEDLFFVPDVVARGDDVGPEVEEFFGEGGGDAEAASGVLAIDDEEVDGIGFNDVGEVFADDVTASGAEDIADKEDIHDFWRLARGEGWKGRRSSLGGVSEGLKRGFETVFAK